MDDTEEDMRKEALKRFIEGEKQVNICRILGKSKSWLNKWVKRYSSGSNEWYKGLSKRPKTIPNKLDDQLVNDVIRIRESLMEGDGEYAQYGFLGAEAIQFHMEELN